MGLLPHILDAVAIANHLISINLEILLAAIAKVLAWSQSEDSDDQQLLTRQGDLLLLNACFALGNLSRNGSFLFLSSWLRGLSQPPFFPEQKWAELNAMQIEPRGMRPSPIVALLQQLDFQIRSTSSPNISFWFNWAVEGVLSGTKR